MPANLTTKLGQLVDVLTPDTTGKIGINMVPSNVLDITQTANSASYARIQNASAGSSAAVGWQITNNTSSSYAAVFGGSFTPSGMGRADGFILQSGGAGGLSFNTVGAQPIYFGINSTEAARFDTSSNLLIGTTGVTGGLNGKVINLFGSSTVRNIIQTTGQYAVVNMGSGGTSASPTTTAFLLTDGTANTAGVGTGTSTPLQFFTNNTEVARFGSNGTFAIGTTDTTTYAVPLVVFKSGGSGTHFVAGGLSGQGISLFMNICGASGYNAGEACAIGGGYAVVNNRSANFGGTVNASGSDYAEYMVKADGCGVITKGSICGVDVTGELTDKFSNAHSFVIKSTNPSYVGGDTWGSSEILGDNPSLRGKSGNETDAAYQTRVTDFETKADAARQKVDRIAFSGQVPVNVTGATVGDYIVPVAGPDGGIAGEAVTNPTFDQYRAAVGRVWKILEDGRAFVSVKVS